MFFFLLELICYLKTALPKAARSLRPWRPGRALGFCALDSGLGLSCAVLLPVISRGGCILLGCRRLVPSACLFSRSLERIYKCGFFFSMADYHFPLLYFYCPCSCRKSFCNCLFSYRSLHIPFTAVWGFRSSKFWVYITVYFICLL